MTTAPRLETLDQWEAQMVADYMRSFGVLSLRVTSAHAARVIVAPQKCKRHNIKWMFFKSVALGSYDMCVLTYVWLNKIIERQEKYDYINIMFRTAANKGHLDICVAAKELLALDSKTPNRIAIPDDSPKHQGIEKATRTEICTAYSKMICGAAEGGHRDICIIAKEWADAAGVICDFNEMLYGAAKCPDGDRALDLCTLARGWLDAVWMEVAADYSKMLEGATESGHRDLCVLAYDWHNMIWEEVAANYNKMIKMGAKGTDPIRACDLRTIARVWKQKDIDFNNMLIIAARNGHRDLCILAREWHMGSKPDIPLRIFPMFIAAAESGHNDICTLAREWHAQYEPDTSVDMSEVINDAADRGRVDICKLLLEWKSSGLCLKHGLDFNLMLFLAARRGHRDFCIFVKEWVDADNARHKAQCARDYPEADYEPLFLDFNRMLCEAAVGYVDVCILAKKWLDEAHIDVDFEHMIYRAKQCQCQDICNLARSWMEARR